MVRRNFKVKLLGKNLSTPLSIKGYTSAQTIKQQSRKSALISSHFQWAVPTEIHSTKVWMFTDKPESGSIKLFLSPD